MDMSNGTQVTVQQQDATSWGQLISDARKAHLNAWAERQSRQVSVPIALREAGQPHASLLTGADVFWLAKRSLVGSDGDPDTADEVLRAAQRMSGSSLQLSDLHLEGAYLSGAHLEGAYLSGAHLEGAILQHAHLESGMLSQAHLEGAALSQAHLEGADLQDAHLNGTVLSKSHLEAANLAGAHLQGAILVWAHLEGACLRGAHLEGVLLQQAHLESKRYAGADTEWKRLLSLMPDFPQRLPVADLQGVTISDSTNFTDVVGVVALRALSVRDRWIATSRRRRETRL